MIKENTQKSPYPHILEKLVKACSYKPNWRFFWEENYDRGQGCEGLSLIIHMVERDTYHPDKTIRVNHIFHVPPANYNEQSWRRWLFERILEVERHEAAEFFQIDGQRPYAPNHGPGNDPYIITELGDLQDRRTNFLGEKRDTDAPQQGKF